MRVNTALLAGTMAIGLATASLYKAEPQSRAPLAFEVASIKPNATGDNRVQMQVAPGGRMNMTGVTMKLLIRNAFRIQDFQTMRVSECGTHQPAQLFNNRTLEKMFHRFESVKFFLTREHLREVIVKR